MKRSGLVAVGIAIMLSTLGSYGVVEAERDGERRLSTRLSGLNEPPAVLTRASGGFEAIISRDRTGFEYTLTYEDLQGDITQSHIHIGQVLVNGGIAVWLCQTATNVSPVPTTPMCPGPRSGTVHGQITAADVIGPNGQGVAPMELEEVLNALGEGVAYVNVHSRHTPSGEIRGQLQLGGNRGRSGDR